MTSRDLGNRLNALAFESKAQIFKQGELTQLTFSAYSLAIHHCTNTDEDPIKMQYPIGLRPDRTVMPGDREYSRSEIIEQFNFLANRRLAENTVQHCVIIVEALFSDILREIIKFYPQKIEKKRTLPLSAIFEASSIDEIYIYATDVLLNQLSYMSPSDFSDEFCKFTGIKLLESPSFHKYCEIKATRDVIVHNRGVANDVYVRKASTFARVQKGALLPIDSFYFLESYECILKLVEWIEIQLHERWHSSQYENRKNQLQLPLASTNHDDQ